MLRTDESLALTKVNFTLGFGDDGGDGGDDGWVPRRLSGKAFKQTFPLLLGVLCAA